MEFKSILFGESSYQLQEGEPEFFRDLQLDYLLRIIRNYEKDYKIEPYFYTLPGDRDIIQYRQQILKDLLSEDLFVCIEGFCKKMKKSRRLASFEKRCEEIMQKSSYHLESAVCYWEGLNELEEGMAVCSFSSNGLQAFYTYLREMIEKLKIAGFEEAMNRARKYITGRIS